VGALQPQDHLVGILVGESIYTEGNDKGDDDAGFASELPTGWSCVYQFLLDPFVVFSEYMWDLIGNSASMCSLVFERARR